MPTFRRRPVPTVPLPESIMKGTLPQDTPVYYLQATGEIFLDYQ
jgi:bromodomain adjacent to zinc finger domain protein 1A